MAVVRIVAATATGTTPEQTLEGWINGWGHSVDIIDDADAVPGGIDIFVVMDTCSGASLSTKYRDLTQYVIWCKPGVWDDNLLATVGAYNATGDGGSGSGATLDPQTTTAAGAAINAGLSDPLAFRASGTSGRWGVDDSELAGGAQIIAASLVTNSDHIVAWFLPSGGAYTVGNGNAPGPRAGMGHCVDTGVGVLTADAQTQFRRVLEYPASLVTPFRGWGVPVA